jgi:hypothetical protein
MHPRFFRSLLLLLALFRIDVVSAQQAKGTGTFVLHIDRTQTLVGGNKLLYIPEKYQAPVPVVLVKSSNGFLKYDTFTLAKGEFCFRLLPDTYDIKLIFGGEIVECNTYNRRNIIVHQDSVVEVKIGLTQDSLMAFSESTDCLFNNVISAPLCQKCGRNDKVVSIAFTMGERRVRVHSWCPRRFIYEGWAYSACDAWWYCTRDEVELLKYYW